MEDACQAAFLGKIFYTPLLDVNNHHRTSGSALGTEPGKLCKDEGNFISYVTAGRRKVVVKVHHHY